MLQSLGRVGGGWDWPLHPPKCPEYWRCNPSDGLGVVGTLPLCPLHWRPSRCNPSDGLGVVGTLWPSASRGSSPSCNPSDGLGVVGTAVAVRCSSAVSKLQSLGRVGGGWDPSLALSHRAAFLAGSLPRTSAISIHLPRILRKWPTNRSSLSHLRATLPFPPTSGSDSVVKEPPSASHLLTEPCERQREASRLLGLSHPLTRIFSIIEGHTRPDRCANRLFLPERLLHWRTCQVFPLNIEKIPSHQKKIGFSGQTTGQRLRPAVTFLAEHIETHPIFGFLQMLGQAKAQFQILLLAQMAFEEAELGPRAIAREQSVYFCAPLVRRNVVGHDIEGGCAVVCHRIVPPFSALEKDDRPALRPADTWPAAGPATPDSAGSWPCSQTPGAEFPC